VEKIERIIVAALALTLLAGIGWGAYRRSRPAQVRIERAAGWPGAVLPPAAAPEAPADAARARININRADAAELAALKGIGKTTAERIVAYRADHGLYLTPADIKKVKGIGEALYEKIKDDISVE